MFNPATISAVPVHAGSGRKARRRAARSGALPHGVSGFRIEGQTPVPVACKSVGNNCCCASQDVVVCVNGIKCYAGGGAGGRCGPFNCPEEPEPMWPNPGSSGAQMLAAIRRANPGCDAQCAWDCLNEAKGWYAKNYGHDVPQSWIYGRAVACINEIAGLPPPPGYSKPVCEFCGGRDCCPPNQCINGKCMLGVTAAPKPKRQPKRQPKGLSLRAKKASTGRASKVLARRTTKKTTPFGGCPPGQHVCGSTPEGVEPICCPNQSHGTESITVGPDCQADPNNFYCSYYP
jgi:hypothetical protein